MRKLKVNYFQLSGFIFIALVLGVVVFFIYLPDYTRLKHLRKENIRLKKKIEKLKEEIAKIENNLKQLDNDPFFWEKLARKNMKVLKKNEILVDIKSEEE